MSNNLSGKSAVVTGSTRGIGFAIAKGGSIEETAAAFVKVHWPSSIIQRAASVEEVAIWWSMSPRRKLRRPRARRSELMAWSIRSLRCRRTLSPRGLAGEGGRRSQPRRED